MKYSRIVILIALILEISFFVKSADAQSDPWATIDPSNQNLIFWHNHTRYLQEALQTIVQDFNESNPYGITVTQETQGSYADISRKMLALLGTQELPDLVVAYQSQAAAYQMYNALVDMTSLLQSPKWGLSAEEQADFFPAFFQQDISPLFNNMCLGLALNRSMEVLYYNSDWLKELGYDKPPSTPRDFEDMVCKATKNPFSRVEDSRGTMGYQIGFDASHLASWIFAFGSDIFDYETNKYTYDNDATKKDGFFAKSL